MRKLAVVITLFMCVILLFSSCSGRKDELDSLKKQELKHLYHDSTVIAMGKCVGYNEDGSMAKMTMTRVLAGSDSKKGDIYCANSKIELNAEYLMFLEQPVENTGNRYDADNCTVIEIEDDGLLWDQRTYALSDVMFEINGLNAVISVPAMTYYYDKRDEFLTNSEVIVVGKVMGMPEKKQTKLISRTTGATIENTMSCMRIEIEVTGSLRGSYGNGSKLQVVYIPELLSSMTDATTLSTVSMKESDVLSIGTTEYYIFFLEKSPDPKQEYLFPINPAQGWVTLYNDTIVAADNNTMMRDCTGFSQLVNEINS